MTRRRWGFPSLLADGLARPQGSPDAAPAPLTVVEDASADSGARRPLSWDREDEALAASPAECPWCPDIDFPDVAALLRHVVMHARGWQTEAIHSERLRRAAVGKVRLFADEVAEMARGLGGAS